MGIIEVDGEEPDTVRQIINQPAIIGPGQEGFVDGRYMGEVTRLLGQNTPKGLPQSHQPCW